jgi:hypothetical protein
MQYLGGLRGAGVLTYGDETAARADYDFDGFLTKSGQVTGSGEIRMCREALREAFGRNDLQLLTEDGRRLSLQFSDKQLRSASNAAHVDVAGGLPPVSNWPPLMSPAAVVASPKRTMLRPRIDPIRADEPGEHHGDRTCLHAGRAQAMGQH